MLVRLTTHGFLVLECFVILVLVGGKSVLTQDQFGQVERETVGIFECEHIDTTDLGLTGFLSVCHELVEQTDSFIQRTEESLFLGLDDRCDLCLLFNQFRVRLTEILDELRNELVEEGRAHVQERISVTHGATQDTTNDVTGFLVRWQLTVRDSEGDGTDVIGDDTHSNIGLLVLAVFTTADSTDLMEHRLEDVRVVVGSLTLDGTHQTLKAHTGVDHFHGQRFERAVCLTVILHEDNIPDLDDLRVVFVNQVASGYSVALVERTTVHVDLRRRTTRTTFSHFPEIIMFVAVDDVIGRQVFSPDSCRLVVASKSFFGRTLKDRCIQVRRVDLEHIHDIFPREIDGFGFEIITERPVTEHLEHGVVVGIVSYFLQVIMLTRHAQTFLTVCHTRVLDGVIT